MRKIKFTLESISALPAPDPSGKQTIYWDQSQPGFGLMASGLTAIKSFVAQKNVGGINKRITLGTVEKYMTQATKAKLELAEAETTLAEARAEDNAVKKARAEQARIKAMALIDPIRAARDDCNLMAEAIRSGRDPKSRSTVSTLAEALEDYCANKKSVGARTKGFYQTTINKYFKNWLNTRLSRITPQEIVQRIGEIQREVAENRQATAERLGENSSDVYANPAGNSTANVCFRTLRSIWKRASRFNPEIPRWDPEQFEDAHFRILPREKHIPSDKLKAFVEAVNAKNKQGEYLIGEDRRDYVLLSLFTGLRSGDVLGLKWSQVEIVSRILRRSQSETKGQRTSLALPMSDFVWELLAARLSRRLDKKNDWVFPGEARSGHFEHPRAALRAISKKCGFYANPHCLRHTYTTVSEHCSISNDRRIALTGHVKGKDVTANYTHLSTEDLRIPAQLVADKIMEYAGIEKPKAALKLA